jgi:hypothetical protein
MKREIKNRGEYVECDADRIIDEFEKLKQAKVIVIKKARIELSGDDKNGFLDNFSSEKKACEVLQSFNTLDNQQKSDYVLRNMVNR